MKGEYRQRFYMVPNNERSELNDLVKIILWRKYLIQGSEAAKNQKAPAPKFSENKIGAGALIYFILRKKAKRRYVTKKKSRFVLKKIYLFLRAKTERKDFKI